MKIDKIFSSKKPVISFEFFPPKRDGNLEKLFEAIEDIQSIHPDFVSITYGAGGGTREMTFEIAIRMKRIGVCPLVHLTCIGHTREEIRILLKQLQQEGIENILALRGDPPKSLSGSMPPSQEIKYASELVHLIRQENFPFSVGVAAYPEGHPEARDRQTDFGYLKSKINQGAHFAITQLFFDNQDYFQLVQWLQQQAISIPIQPGIWILTDYQQIQKIVSLSHSKFPEVLNEKIKRVQEDSVAVTEAGIEYATRQCQELLQLGAPGIHFYTMNKSYAALRVYRNLKQAGCI
jgi:methylenetetrahydrofolate reductase (NADPH)